MVTIKTLPREAWSITIIASARTLEELLVWRDQYLRAYSFQGYGTSFSPPTYNQEQNLYILKGYRNNSCD